MFEFDDPAFSLMCHFARMEKGIPAFSPGRIGETPTDHAINNDEPDSAGRWLFYTRERPKRG
jgi:hypothetical protein